MASLRLVVIALLCEAAWSSDAEESCTSAVDAPGSAMLQVSDNYFATPKVQSHPAHNESERSHPAHKESVEDKESAKGKTPANSSAKLLKNKGKRKAKTPDSSNVALSASGYNTIADMCCLYEMEEFARRAANNENLKICDEGGLQGIVPYYSCENKQNYTTLLEEIKSATTGLCPWVAKKDEQCKKTSKSCGAPMDPMSHRRRNCGRNDNSKNLDVAMQNAATNEFFESSCGTHQQYTDVASVSGVLKKCKVEGDVRGNQTALRVCLKECCETDKCIGISSTADGTTLQENFEDASATTGAVSYLHRQR